MAINAVFGFVFWRDGGGFWAEDTHMAFLVEFLVGMYTFLVS